MGRRLEGRVEIETLIEAETADKLVTEIAGATSDVIVSLQDRKQF